MTNKLILNALFLSIGLMAQSDNLNNDKMNKLIYNQAALHTNYFDDSPTNSLSDYRYTASFDDDIEHEITISKVNSYNGYDIFIDHGDNEVMKSIIGDFLTEYDKTHIRELEYAYPFAAFIESCNDHVIAITMAISQNEGTKYDTCQIGTLNIHEDHKGRDLEKILLYHIEQYAKLYNNSAIIAEANDSSKNMFLDNGFIIIESVPKPGNKTAYTMRKLIQQDTLINQAELLNLSKINCKLTVRDEKNEDTFYEKLRSLTNESENDNDDEISDEEISSDNFVIYALSKEGEEDEIAGGIYASIVTLSNDEIYCDIHLVALNEIYRNKRLGSKLLAEVEKYAQSKGCQFMQLFTFEWQAKGFYEKQGFTVTGETPNPEGCSGQASYYMKKIL